METPDEIFSQEELNEVMQLSNQALQALVMHVIGTSEVKEQYQLSMKQLKKLLVTSTHMHEMVKKLCKEKGVGSIPLYDE